MSARSLFAVVCCCALVAWFWVRGERAIAANGPTFDEPVHLTAGYSYWVTGSFRLNREDPPLLKLLWAIPLLFGERPEYPHDVAEATNNDHWHVSTAFVARAGVPPPELFAWPRRVNLLIGCCVVLTCAWWAHRLWESRLAGVAACAFAAHEPTLLALSCVLTTDAGLALFVLLSAYLLWEYAARPSRGLLFACGAALGLALASKFSALAAVLGLFAAAALFVLRGGRLALPGAPDDAHRGRAFAEFAFRLGLIAGVVLLLAYGVIHFDQWGRGLKFQLTRGEHGDGTMYLNGALSRRGWLHYFAVLLPLKLPLGLIFAGFLAALTGRADRAPRAALFVVPPLAFFALASLARVDLGARVVLPVLPFVCVLAAGLLTSAQCARGCSPHSESCPTRFARCGIVTCVAWAGISAARSDPYPVAYFNEVAGGPRGAMRFVADSNLDWGQGLPALRDYMRANELDRVYLSYFGTDRPEAYGIRFHPLLTYGRVGAPGGEEIPPRAPRHVVVVSANNLLGIYLRDAEAFAFLRAREPVAVLAGSLFVYDLTRDPAALDRARALSLR
jgi:hypothetical protein